MSDQLKLAPRTTQEIAQDLRVARGRVKVLEEEHWLATTEMCSHCDGKGDVWCHDPSGDGHGGLNGGSWGWLQCGTCHGKGRVPHKGSSI